MKSNEEIEKKHLEYKKIVLRFFKECGFFNEWKIYLKRRGIENTWYKKTYVDSIIGSLSFTDYVKSKYNLRLPLAFSTLFRTYITVIGKNKEYPLHYSNRIYNEKSIQNKYFNIDKLSHTIKIYGLNNEIENEN